jgi:hypothetical protein
MWGRDRDRARDRDRDRNRDRDRDRARARARARYRARYRARDKDKAGWASSSCRWGDPSCVTTRPGRYKSTYTSAHIAGRDHRVSFCEETEAEPSGHERV